ncbi:hypothetical protein [Paenibacillus illinoisensis]|uniref:hypothetical protein n=1 Tax=Paenibacillus illinoisensis TaxID=59845 RepID=UPI00204016D4|nr:hypothetical protein [Paenibacillus illinoisensis]MCM3205677.1 hypothetical protein [Paenibacillus illinoisensis]
MKIRLTPKEIAEYNAYRRDIVNAMTRSEVAVYTEKCLDILRRGERRYAKRLQRED